MGGGFLNYTWYYDPKLSKYADKVRPFAFLSWAVIATASVPYFVLYSIEIVAVPTIDNDDLLLNVPQWTRFRLWFGAVLVLLPALMVIRPSLQTTEGKRRTTFVENVATVSPASTHGDSVTTDNDPSRHYNPLQAAEPQNTHVTFLDQTSVGNAMFSSPAPTFLATSTMPAHKKRDQPTAELADMIDVSVPENEIATADMTFHETPIEIFDTGSGSDGDFTRDTISLTVPEAEDPDTVM